MKAKIVTLENKSSGDITLKKDIFGVEIRKSLLNRAVVWQLSKRQAGTHKTKIVGEVRGTTAKPFRQKGTGRARQGSSYAVQMRGGAVSFGPVVRSHAKQMPKKLRKLALKTALSLKLSEGSLVVLKEAKTKQAKTSEVKKLLEKNGWLSSLIIDGDNVDENFKKSVSNIPLVDILPAQGANVYDILKRDNLILTEDAIKKLEERLS